MELRKGFLRLESIDVVRGIAMILMALDHVRDFFGAPGTNPVDIATTTVPLFLTRWITHVCAPVFFLLTGTGAFLALRRISKAELSTYLLTRGVWLLFLEVVVVRCLGMQFNFDYRVTLLTVLWALGWAMIFLALLVRLPVAVVTAIGIIMIAGHNLLDGLELGGPWWTFLHGQGFLIRTAEHVVFVAYPIIPWIGVTSLGFGLGVVFAWPPERRRAFLVQCGVALCLAFIALRAINGYGDPSRWSAQPSVAMTMVSFLNTTKYPPSLLFLLMTLGPALLLLRAMDHAEPAWLRPALVLGKVPLFYFLVHLTLIHLLTVIVGYARYGAIHWFFESPSLDRYPFTFPPEWGYSLPAVYLIWLLVVALLYPLCHWYAGVKQRSTAPLLRYL